MWRTFLPFPLLLACTSPEPKQARTIYSHAEEGGPGRAPELDHAEYRPGEVGPGFSGEGDCRPLDLRAGGTIHVEVDGDDGGSGGAGCPLASLEAARDLARSWRDRAAGDLMIELGGGTWWRSAALELGPEDSGPVGFRSIWRVAEGEEAVINGGLPVVGWVQDEATQLWKAPLPGPIRDLAVHGSLAMRARAHRILEGDMPWNGSAWDSVDYAFAAEDLVGAEMVSYAHRGVVRCRIERAEGTLIYPSAGCAEMIEAWVDVEDMEYDRIEGLASLLNTSREYLIDEARGLVWLKLDPGLNPEVMEITGSSVETLISINGSPEAPVERVSIEGLGLERAAWWLPGTDAGLVGAQFNWYHGDTDSSDLAWVGAIARPPAALELHGGRDIRLERISISGVGGVGVAIDQGSEQVTLTESTIYNTGASGILVGDPRDHHDLVAAPKDIELSENQLRVIGFDFQESVGIWLGFTQRARVEHNTIDSTPYSGIAVGWGFGLLDEGGNPSWGVETEELGPTVAEDNLILENRVVFFQNELPVAGGGIHIIGAQPGMVVENNALITNGGRWLSEGALFLDDGARYAELRGNMVEAPIPTFSIRDAATPTGVCGSARDNLLLDNRGKADGLYSCEGQNTIELGDTWDRLQASAEELELWHSTGVGAASDMQEPDWVALGQTVGGRFSYSLATVGDLDGDGDDELLVGAPETVDNDTSGGLVQLYSGGPDGPELSWSLSTDQVGARLGMGLDSAGDVNGDGLPDLLVGAVHWDGAEADEGAVLLYFGGEVLATEPDWSTTGGRAGAGAGVHPRGLGDVNGDGFDDIGVDVSGWDEGALDAGRAELYLGAEGGPAASPDDELSGFDRGGRLGGGLDGAGDVNGDGYADTLVAEPHWGEGEDEPGRVQLLPGGPEGWGESIWTQTGPEDMDNFGHIVSGAGDVDGDGFDDVLIGATGQAWMVDQGGSVYLYCGGPIGLIEGSPWQAGLESESVTLGGAAVAGDLTGDGLPEVLIGAENVGQVHLNEGELRLFGNTGGALSPDPVWHTVGGQLEAHQGWSVAIGDYNGDGSADLASGAWSWDELAADRGRLLLWFSPLDG